MNAPFRASACACLLLAAACPAAAQEAPEPSSIDACVAIESDAQRLACYDAAMHRDAPFVAEESPANPVFPDEPGPRVADAGSHRSLLDSRWELSPESKLGTFNMRAYQPIYIMPVFATSNVNELPSSPNPNNTVTIPEQLDSIEMKFQLSFKTKVWQGVFGEYGDIWATYTQSSRWQLYNSEVSRPFRETNYEPEGMLVFNTNYKLLGWDGRLLGIGINHQSNGRSDPYSRSWNRIIGAIGFERDGWTLMLRPWWRVNEAARNDNNPDIEDYVGRGEVQVVRVTDTHQFSLLLRHSLRGGDRSRGSLRYTWSFPISRSLRGYAEIFTGYGESLIDYNHRATYLGVGLSLLDWY